METRGAAAPIFADFQGKTAAAFAVEPDPVWSLKWVPSAPVDRFGYGSLRFAFHPGDLTAPSSTSFVLRFNREDRMRMLDWVDLENNEWQQVEIPLQAFELQEPLELIELSGNVSGTFYLNDLRLVVVKPPAMTAVREDHLDETPISFSLGQNFPNPFNSGSAFRFALARSADVELAVYNLAGQKVATLVQGHREAGSHSLRWDGQDDAGRELASGVYLYRLRADRRSETRKLLLLR